MPEPSPVSTEPLADPLADPPPTRLTPHAAHDFTPPMNAVLPRRRSQAWTLANCLTYGRLVAVPVVVVLLFWPDEFAAAKAVFPRPKIS